MFRAIIVALVAAVALPAAAGAAAPTVSQARHAIAHREPAAVRIDACRRTTTAVICHAHLYVELCDGNVCSPPGAVRFTLRVRWRHHRLVIEEISLEPAILPIPD